MPTQRSELLRSGLVSLVIGFNLLVIITSGTNWFVQAELHNCEETRHAVNVQGHLAICSRCCRAPRPGNAAIC